MAWQDSFGFLLGINWQRMWTHSWSAWLLIWKKLLNISILVQAHRITMTQWVVVMIVIELVIMGHCAHMLLISYSMQCDTLFLSSSWNLCICMF